MVFLALFLTLLVGLAVAALWEKTPDTHREVTQHGNYNF